jgi:hypothetical protein
LAGVILPYDKQRARVGARSLMISRIVVAEPRKANALFPDDDLRES